MNSLADEPKLWPASFKRNIQYCGLFEEQDVTDEVCDVLWDVFTESSRVEVKDQFQMTKLANDNTELRKVLETETARELISNYLLRAMVTYAQWHHCRVDELEIVDARWGANDELIIRFNRD